MRQLVLTLVMPSYLAIEHAFGCFDNELITTEKQQNDTIIIKCRYADKAAAITAVAQLALKKVVYDVVMKLRGSIKQPALFALGADLYTILTLKGKLAVITKRLHKTIMENYGIHVDGFQAFRLQDIKEETEQMLYLLFYDHFIQRRVREFITMLSEHVAKEPIGEQRVHICYAGGTINLYDANFLNITEQFVHNYMHLNTNQDVAANDSILSTLLDVMPGEIIIHGPADGAAPKIIRTITAIFKERVHYCTQCPYCKSNRIIAGLKKLL